MEDDNEMDNKQVEEIYKNLNSLDNQMGREKDHHDHNMAIFNAITDFLEQHVRSISMLSGIPDTLWGTDKEHSQTLAKLDAKDPTHMKT
ncbi:hypothetical protein KI387_033465, partial [Taxus chinensis]